MSVVKRTKGKKHPVVAVADELLEMGVDMENGPFIAFRPSVYYRLSNKLRKFICAAGIEKPEQRFLVIGKLDGWEHDAVETVWAKDAEQAQAFFNNGLRHGDFEVECDDNVPELFISLSVAYGKTEPKIIDNML